MTDDKLKLTLSITGFFLGGVSLAYGVLPDKTAVATLPVAIALFMGGVTGVSGYLTGYSQKNPRNTKTAEQLLESVKASDLPPAVKAQVAPALAHESAQPAAGGAPSVPFVVKPGGPTITLPATPVGLDPVLFADCLAVTRFNAAPTLEAFRLLPADDQAVWRVYIAEVRRREETLVVKGGST